MIRKIFSTRSQVYFLILLVFFLYFSVTPVFAAHESNLSNSSVLMSSEGDIQNLSLATINDFSSSNSKLVSRMSSRSVDFIGIGETVNGSYSWCKPKEYDAMSVSYMTTNGVDLLSKPFFESEKANGVIDVRFDILKSYDGKSRMDAFDYDEDKVVIIVAFLEGEQISHVEKIELWILTTPFGIFTTDLDPILNKRSYIRYLESSNVVDSNVITELDYEFHSVFTDSNKRLECQSIGEVNITSNTQLDTKAIANAIFDMTSKISESNRSLEEENPNRVEISYVIAPGDNGIVISGDVHWYVSNISYPAQSVRIEIIDKDVAINDVIGVVTTDSNGHFEKTIENQNGLFEDGVDIFMKVYTGNEHTYVYDWFADEDTANSILKPYYFCTACIFDVSNTASSRNITETITGVVAHSFSISNALYYARQYEVATNGGQALDDTAVSALYPLDIGENDSSFALHLFEDYPELIFIRIDHFGEWSTILHEYGHIVAWDMNFFVGATLQNLVSYGGFNHDPRHNLTDYYNGNKSKGLEIAWNEGWATYYSWCVQKEFDLASNNYPMTWPTNVVDGYSINGNFCGEDNEIAIAIMFASMVDDGILTDKEIWDLVNAESPQSLDEFVDLAIDKILENNNDPNNVVGSINPFLQILEEQNISAHSKEVIQYSTFCSPFSWDEPELSKYNSNNYDFDYRYKLLVFNLDLDTMYESSFYAGASHTIPAYDWSSIISASPNGFYWCIVTQESSDSLSGTYASQLYFVSNAFDSVDTATLGKQYSFDITKRDSALASDGSVIPAKTTSQWYEFKAPVDATYLFFTEGTVDTYGAVFLSIRSDYDSSGAMASDDDSGETTNCLIRKYLNKGDTVFIRIMGYFSSSTGSSSFSVRIEGVNVSAGTTGYHNIVASNEERWYSFIPDTTGYYAIVATGDGDTECFFYHITSSGDCVTATYDNGGSYLNFGFIQHCAESKEYYFKILCHDVSCEEEYTFYVVPIEEAFIGSKPTAPLNAGSQKWYQFTATHAGTYAFLTYGSIDTEGSLHSMVNPKFSTSLTLGYDNNSGDFSNFFVTYEMDANEVVYICVCGYDTTISGEYELNIVPISNVYENIDTTGYIGAGEQNWYAFTAPRDGEYTFLTTGNINIMGSLHASVNPLLSTGETLAYDDNSGNDNNFMFTYRLEEDETVYICVDGYNDDVFGDYSLRVVYTTFIDTLDVSYENVLNYSGYMIYRFVAPSNGDFTFYTTGEVDLFADVFNFPVLDRESVENRIGYDDDSGNGRNCAVTLYLTEGQEVFVRIRGYSTISSGSYNFVIVKSTQVISEEVAYEGNVSNGSTVWYRYTATEEGTYDFYTTGSLDTYGDLFLFFEPDKSTNTAEASNDDYLYNTSDLMDNFKITYVLSTGQTVYVRVRGYGQYTSGSFDFYVVKQ